MSELWAVGRVFYAESGDRDIWYKGFYWEVQAEAFWQGRVKVVDASEKGKATIINIYFSDRNVIV